MKGQTYNEPVVYVANYKAVEQKEIIEQLKAKRVWAAGTKTWFELAKKGIWVEGCADAFGLEFLQTAWQMPLFNISKEISLSLPVMKQRKSGRRKDGMRMALIQPKKNMRQRLNNG